MHPGVVVAIVLMFLALDVLIVWAIMRTAAATFADIAKDNPAVEPEPGAIRKDFQSFKIGLINLGYSIHVAVDASHLHLLPSLTARWIGMKPLSIPWERIKVQRIAKLTGAKVKIGRHIICGPKWCFELAAPPPATSA